MSEGRESYLVIGRQPVTLAARGLPHQERIDWWNKLPVYWNSNNNKPPPTQGQQKSEL